MKPKLVRESNEIDMGAHKANMYGCQPCPKCGGDHRCVFVKLPGVIQCDDCGHHEKITKNHDAEREE
jgi:hypothetical protein